METRVHKPVAPLVGATQLGHAVRADVVVFDVTIQFHGLPVALAANMAIAAPPLLVLALRATPMPAVVPSVATCLAGAALKFENVGSVQPLALMIG